MCLFVFLPHHSTDHPAEVNRVGSEDVVLIHVALVLRTDLEQLQARFQHSRLILGREGRRVIRGRWGATEANFPRVALRMKLDTVDKMPVY